MNEWISVKDRLPKTKQRVLTIRKNDIKTAEIDFFTGKVWTHDREWDNGEVITHWMPLPEPPKGEAK